MSMEYIYAPFRCDKCPRVFQSPREKKRHMEKIHGRRDK